MPPSPRPPARNRPGGQPLLAIAALCWLLFGLTVLAMTGGGMEGFDRRGLQFWRDGPEPSPFLLEAMRDITAFGGVGPRNLIALGGAGALAMLGARRLALWLLLTVGLGWLANSGAKLLFDRARPDLVPHLMEAAGASFPSGHSFNGAVVYLALAFAFTGFAHTRGARIAMVAGAVLLSLAIAFSRVWLGVHFPSDVIAGWLGGAGWAFLAAGLLAQSSQISAGRATENRPAAREAKRASPTNQPPSSPSDT